ncbi:MAG: hypothetical protein U1F50_03080 [Rubrivivax sp.]
MAAPLWLLGLALLPLIRWLHRSGRHRRAVPVAHLGLWRGAATPAADAERRQPPDPAWRRRALLCALLCGALAGPQWPASQAPVTLWVDDSLHMLTREAEGTRLATGLAEAARRLAPSPPASLEVRSLSDPWRAFAAADAATADAFAATAGWRDAAPPPAALLDSGRRHWLLTDGADARLLAWPDGRAPDELIRIGRVARNVGLERLAARRDAQDPAAFTCCCSRSPTAAPRRVARGRVRHRQGHQRAAGGCAWRPVRLRCCRCPPQRACRRACSGRRARRGRRDRARPRAAGAAPEAADPACAPALRRAAGASGPGPPPGEAGGADLAVDCSAAAAPADVPTLRVLPPRAAPAASTLRWADTVATPRRVALDDGALWTAGDALQPAAGDLVLLAAGDEPLLLRRQGTGPAMLETSVDFEATARHAGTAVPLLVDLMLETLAGAPLLDTLALVERSPAALRVAPAASAPATQTPRSPVAALPGRDTTPLLLALAALVLGWEIAALARQWRRLAA